MIGVLPGIGPVPTVALLLPFYLRHGAGLRLHHAGRHFLRRPVRRPDDRHPRQYSRRNLFRGDVPRWPPDGQAGAGGHGAAIAALSSFFAGTVATVVIALLSGPMSKLALSFTAVEFFSLMVLGLVAAVILAHGSVVKSLAMVGFGLLIGIVGIDVNSRRRTHDVQYSRICRRPRFCLGGDGLLRAGGNHHQY